MKIKQKKLPGYFCLVLGVFLSAIFGHVIDEINAHQQSESTETLFNRSLGSNKFEYYGEVNNDIWLLYPDQIGDTQQYGDGGCPTRSVDGAISTYGTSAGAPALIPAQQSGRCLHFSDAHPAPPKNLHWVKWVNQTDFICISGWPTEEGIYVPVQYDLNLQDGDYNIVVALEITGDGRWQYVSSEGRTYNLANTSVWLVPQSPDRGGCVGRGYTPATLPCVTVPGASPAPNLVFWVKREQPVVWAGVSRPLPEMTDGEYHPLANGHLVTTDSVGEALLQGESGGQPCKVYVFKESKLLKRACPRSSYTGGNTTCSEEGSTVYQGCKNCLIMTPSVEFRVEGSWVMVVYLPDQKRTLITVFEGRVEAKPVIDINARTLGPATNISQGYFWFTNPGQSGDPIAGLAAREPHPLDQLPTVIDALNLWPWFERAQERAKLDSVPFPGWCGPDALYCEYFEDGLAQGWELDSGWQIAQENDNYILSGRDHTWAILRDQAWDDYRVRFRFNLLQGTIHLNYRLAEGPVSYFVGFNEKGLYLSKQTGNVLTDLKSIETPHQLDRWYDVEIAGRGERIQVFVDGELALDYTDSSPLRQGTIAFETLDNSRAQIDNIEVLEAVTPQCEVVTDGLNLRFGPGTNYAPPIRQLDNGTQLQPLAHNSDASWIQVTVIATGQVGWVSASSDYVECNIDLKTLPLEIPTPTPTPTPSPTPIPTPSIELPPERIVLNAPCEACTTLGWKVGNVRAVYLDGERVDDQGSRQACLDSADEYDLISGYENEITYTYNFRVVAETGDVNRTISVIWKHPPISFWADTTELSSGQCTILHWDVENVQAVYLDDQGVIGHDSRTVCPNQSQTYLLRVATACDEEIRRIDISVRPSVEAVVVAGGGGALNDPTVQEALLMGIPWRRLSNEVFPGQDIPIEIKMYGWDKAIDTRTIEYNPDRVMTMVAAGVVDLPSDIGLWAYWEGEPDASMASRIEDSLNEIGVYVRRKPAVSICQPPTNKAILANLCLEFR